MLTHAASRPSTSRRASVCAVTRSGRFVSTTIAASVKELAMRFVLLGIVLVFPLFDLYVTARFARWTGIPLWIWLTAALVAGLWLLRNERLAFRRNTVAALHGEQSLLRGLLDSGRKVLAGILFLVPRILFDTIGLLLFPFSLKHPRLGPPPATAGRAAVPPRGGDDGE